MDAVFHVPHLQQPPIADYSAYSGYTLDMTSGPLAGNEVCTLMAADYSCHYTVQCALVTISVLLVLRQHTLNKVNSRSQCMRL